MKKKSTSAPSGPLIVGERKLTTVEQWEKLSTEKQFKLLQDAEFDAIAWERNYLSKKEEMRTEIEKLKALIKRLEEGEQRDLRIYNQQSEEISELGRVTKTLRQQIKEAGLLPLR